MHFSPSGEDLNWASSCDQSMAIIQTDGLCSLDYFPQKGIASYTLSPNRQRMFPNFWHTAVFNTFRRFRHQVLYVAPPFLIAYSLMDWATEQYVFHPTAFENISTYLSQRKCHADS